MLGLQPEDVMVWALERDEPAVPVVIGQLGGCGPVISSGLVGTASRDSGLLRTLDAGAW